MPRAWKSASAGLAIVLVFSPSGARPQDCNANGIEDHGEIESGLSPDCNGNRVPDECDLQPTIAFGPGARIEIGATVTPPAIGFLDADRDLDIALVRRARGQGSDNAEPALLVVLRNSGDGSLTEVATELPDDPEILVPGDFDGDRDVDLAAVSSGGLRMLHNRGDGTFVAGSFQQSPLGIPLDGATLDADRDGDLDLAVLNGPNLTVLFNTGRGTFPYRSEYSASSSGGQFGSVSIVDEPRDQAPDVFVNSGNALVLFRNLGDGTFENIPVVLSRAVSPLYPTELAQLDGRDGLDAVTALRGAVQVHLRGENGSFPFSAEFPFPGERFPGGPTSVLVFRAGPPPGPAIDVAVSVGGDLTRAGSTTILANDGEGNLRVSGTLPVDGPGYTTTDAADLDDDRDEDIVTVNLEWGIVATWRNDSFGAASADGNRDGIPDVCAVRHFRRGDADDNGSINGTDAQFLLDHLYRGGTPLMCLDAADANDDGLVDLGDAIYTLNYLFLGGPPPPAPGPPPMPCGLDPEGSSKLGCSRYNSC